MVNATEVKAAEVVKTPYLKTMHGIRMWHARVDLGAVYKQDLDLHSFPFFDCQNLVTWWSGSRWGT